jgi:hypothetical protein
LPTRTMSWFKYGGDSLVRSADRRQGTPAPAGIDIQRMMATTLIGSETFLNYSSLRVLITDQLTHAGASRGYGSDNVCPTRLPFSRRCASRRRQRGHLGRCLQPQFFVFHLPQRRKTQASTTANNPNRSEASRRKAMETSPKATKTMAGRVAKGSRSAEDGPASLVGRMTPGPPGDIGQAVWPHQKPHSAFRWADLALRARTFHTWQAWCKTSVEKGYLFGATIPL